MSFMNNVNKTLKHIALKHEAVKNLRFLLRQNSENFDSVWGHEIENIEMQSISISQKSSIFDDFVRHSKIEDFRCLRNYVSLPRN